MRSPPWMMDRLDTSRWRLGSLFALLTCHGAEAGACLDDDDCGEHQYCNEGSCRDDVAECSDGECECVHDCRECFADAECGPDDVCEEGYCESLESIAYLECQHEHALRPLFDDFLPVDGVVDLAFADAQTVIAHPTKVDVLDLDVVVDSIALGEAIVAIDASDLDADGDADLVLADRGQGGRLLVLTRDADGAFVPSGEVASPGVLDVHLRERDGAMPDALVRTDAGVSMHLGLGEAETLVDGVVSALAVHGDALIYAGDGTWWIDLATPGSSPVRLDDRTAVAVGWGRIVDDDDAIASFGDPASLRVWSQPGEPTLEHALDGPSGGVLTAFLAADLVGDGIDDLVAWTSVRFVVVSNRPDDAVACVVGNPIGDGMRPLLDLGDVNGDSTVDIAMSQGTHFVLWTLESAVD